MPKIFKYQFSISDIITIEMPIGAQVLTFDTQNNTPTLWALVEPDMDTEKRTFYIFGIGQNVPDNFDASAHIGTVQIDGEEWHLFE